MVATANGAVAQPGGGGGAHGARPHRMSYGGILTFFLQNVTKKAMFYNTCKMKWPKSEEKIEIGGPWEIRGPSAGVLTFFLQNFTNNTLYHICKMNWPKSEEKIEIGVVALRS